VNTPPAKAGGVFTHLSTFLETVCRPNRATPQPVIAGQRLWYYAQHGQGLDLCTGRQLYRAPVATASPEFQQAPGQEFQTPFSRYRPCELAAWRAGDHWPRRAPRATAPPPRRRSGIEDAIVARTSNGRLQAPPVTFYPPRRFVSRPVRNHLASRSCRTRAAAGHRASAGR